MSSNNSFSSIIEAKMGKTYEQNVRWCLNDLLSPSWHFYRLKYHLPSSNFHLRVYRGKTQRQSKRMESFRCIWPSVMKKNIDKEPRDKENGNAHWDNEYSSTWVLISDLLAVAPIFKSTRNSGKLRKQSARRASNPSLSSFLSSAWSVSRRDGRSFQCGRQ